MDADPRIEWLKCSKSVIYFVITYVHIYNATISDWIRFELWPSQRSTLRTMAESSKALVLKARQLGLSWLVLAYCLHVMIFQPPATILLFSLRKDEAIELLRRVKGMYARLPPWMQARQITEDNKTSFELSNGSRALAFPTTGGRSYTGTVAVVDEADFVPNLANFLNAVKPTIDAGGQLFLISTSDKKRPLSTFKRLFRATLKGVGDYVGIFLPWSARPDRDQAWYDSIKAEMHSQRGTNDDLYAEYPETIAQALAPETLDRRIPFEWIEAVTLDVAPVETDILNLLQCPALPGLAIWQVPEHGERYVIGADPAEGNPNSDESSAQVLNARTWDHVATLAGRFEPSVFAEYIDALGRWYHDAPVLPERNNHGHAVILKLRELGHLQIIDGHDGKPVWLSNIKGKPLMYTALADAIRERATNIADEETASQIASIEASTLLAPEGMHDDRADPFALAITALALCKLPEHESFQVKYA